MQQAEAKLALIQWAEDQGISPADFAKATGYSYQHAWGLLRGKRHLTQATVGRLLSTYGVAPAALVIAAMDNQPSA